MNSPPPNKNTPNNNIPKPKKTNNWFKKILIFIFVIFPGFAIASVITLRFTPIPITYLMIKRAFQGDKIYYKPVGIKKINRSLISAAIAGEDARFCSHNGFEFEAMQNAWKANKRGNRLKGASTISQQTAKNVFLWPDRSYVRKGFEAGYTVLIETLWPKWKIMESYLNVAEMGKGIFGAEAAARYYFKKSASELTPYESARLIAILPSPRKWSVKSPNNRVNRKIRRVTAGARVVRNSGLDKCAIK